MNQIPFGHGFRVNLAIYLLITAGSVGIAHAQASPFTQPPASLSTAASIPRVPDGSDVDILEMQESYDFAPDGSSVYRQYMVYKVLSSAGVENWNDLSTDWSPWLDQRPTLQARIIGADGTTYDLDPATIADSPAQATDETIYSDARTLRAPLPGIAQGSVVESLIIRRGNAPFAAAGWVARSFFQMSQPVQHFRLTLRAPAAVALRYSTSLLPGLLPVQSVHDGVTEWIFDSGPMPAHEDPERGVPSDVHTLPVITFSTAESWHAVAESYAKIVDDRIARGAVDELAQKVTRDRAASSDKIDAIVAYLNHEIRYTGIEFGEANVLPHSPNETLKRKYGDCKDKATLLVAMLRAAGIPANLALLNAGDRLDVTPELPGMGLFDHAIVYVPGNTALWIDATDENARPGQLPDNDRGRWALIIDPKTTAMTKVVDARSIDNEIVEEREVYLANNGPARIVEISEPQGTFDSDYRHIYADLDNKKTHDSLTDYFKHQYFAESLDRMEHTDPKNPLKAFRLTLEGKRARRGWTDLEEASAYIQLDELFTELPLELKTHERTAAENAKATRPTHKRVADYELSRPFVAEWRYKIIPPLGFEPASLPTNADLALGPAHYTASFSSDSDGTVRAVLRFDSVQRRFTVAEQTDLKEKIADLLDGEIIKIKFELRAHVLLAAGKARESFDAYRALVGNQPNDAVAHLRRAAGYLQAGMGQAARREARRAITLDPKLAFAQMRLANILQYDSIGRWHGPGADYPGAAVAYRAAIALDPEAKNAIADYAILLEHDEHGIRFGAHADLKAAIVQYQRLTAKELADLSLPNNLASAQFHTRDFVAAKQTAEQESSPPLALIIACETELHGVPQAMEEARRRTNGDDSYKQTLAAAAKLLMNLREYREAADLLEEGASGQNAAAIISLANILRKAQRHEDIPKGKDPEAFVKSTLVAMLSEDYSVDVEAALSSQVAVSLIKNLSEEERNQSTRAARILRSGAVQNDLAPDVLIDIILPSSSFRTTGNDRDGYRVVVQSPGQRNTSFFVVKENEQYKILVDGERPSALGVEVVERVQRQDVQGAAALLDMLRDITPIEGGDDPLGGNPFPKTWIPGHGEMSAQQITVAAASLMVQSPHTAKQGVALLETAVGSGPNEQDAQHVQLGLMIGYLQLEQYASALASADALAKGAPLSRRVYQARLTALLGLRRFDEAEEAARQRLTTLPGDLDAMKALSSVSACRHQYGPAYEFENEATLNSHSGASELNELAWLTLFFDRNGGPDIDSAVRSTQLRQNVAGSLHTLGSLYAEVGKTKEARETLLQAMSVGNLEEPNGDYWYAFGRIAEQYGENDIAREDYAQVKPSKMMLMEPISTYRLAQHRLTILQEATKAH